MIDREFPPLKVDPFLHDKEDPTRWMNREGFFVICSGRWREMGWGCGQFGFDWRYTQWLMGRADRAQRQVIALHG